jgi:hypothetical protein
MPAPNAEGKIGILGMGPDTFSKFQDANCPYIWFTGIYADEKRRKTLKYMTFILLSIYIGDDLLETGI